MPHSHAPSPEPAEPPRALAATTASPRRRPSWPARREPPGTRSFASRWSAAEGRGKGATVQALNTKNCRLVAVADAFQDRADDAINALMSAHPDSVSVTRESTFVGFDAYQKALDSDVDVVILATPPGFRPWHFEYAINPASTSSWRSPSPSTAGHPHA